MPVDLSETPDFQRRVLEAASRIPFGEVRPYAWVAQRIGHPRAVRAVGTALGRNPVPFIVPCHRVLQSGGGIGGYLFGSETKSGLLALERTTPIYEGCASTHIDCGGFAPGGGGCWSTSSRTSTERKPSSSRCWPARTETWRSWRTRIRWCTPSEAPTRSTSPRSPAIIRNTQRSCSATTSAAGQRSSTRRRPGISA